MIAAHPYDNVIIATHSFLNGGAGIEQGNGGYGDTSSNTCTTASSGRSPT